MADDIIKIETHEDDAYSRLGAQYRNKPFIEGLVRSTGKLAQELEDLLISYLDARKISNATGALLDYVGSIVGAERQGLEDDLYRILVFVKIAENYTEGQPGPLMNAYKLMTNATSVEYKNIGGGEVELISNGYALIANYDFAIQQLERLLAAGVALSSITFVPTEDAFKFDESAGFANAAGVGGGKLAIYIPI